MNFFCIFDVNIFWNTFTDHLIVPQDGSEIKNFVEYDLETLYSRAEYSFVCKSGVGPVALFYDQEGEVVETIQLDGMKRFDQF